MGEWKESEIGTIPSDWTVGIFENDLRVQGRIGWKGYKTSDLVEFGPYVVGGAEIKSSIYLNLNNAQHLTREKFDESPEIMLKDGDVLLVTRGNLGEVGYFWKEYGEATINPSVIILSNFVGNSKFLFYYLISRQGNANVLSLSGGSSVPAIYQADVKKIKYPKPPNEEQTKIAEIVFSIDQKIDLLHRQNKTLEQLAETLFRQWFVEEADESWEAVKLKTLCEIITKGTTPTTLGKQFVSTGINFLKVESLTEDGDFIESKFAHIDLETDKLLSRSRIKTNDVLITIAGTIGRVAIVPERILPANTNQAIAIIRVNSEILNPVLIFLLLKSPVVINDFESRVVHAVQPNLSLGEIGDIGLRLPPKELLIKFSDEINLVFSKKEKNNIQIRTLTQLRDTLLPKLMSGEVRVNIK